MTASILALLAGVVTIGGTWIAWWIKTQPERLRQRRIVVIARLEQELSNALATNDMLAVARCNDQLRLLYLQTGRPA